MMGWRAWLTGQNGRMNLYAVHTKYSPSRCAWHTRHGAEQVSPHLLKHVIRAIASVTNTECNKVDRRNSAVPIGPVGLYPDKFAGSLFGACEVYVRRCYTALL